MEYCEEVENLDPFIGKRVKLRRSEMGMSQAKLGEKLGLSFQQVQKYENGKNRISASTLFQISRILGVDFSYFVDGFGESVSLHEDEDVTYEVYNREASLLSGYFQKIHDPALRKQILDLVKKIASLSEDN